MRNPNIPRKRNLKKIIIAQSFRVERLFLSFRLSGARDTISIFISRACFNRTALAIVGRIAKYWDGEYIYIVLVFAFLIFALAPMDGRQTRRAAKLKAFSRTEALRCAPHCCDEGLP